MPYEFYDGFAATAGIEITALKPFNTGNHECLDIRGFIKNTICARYTKIEDKRLTQFFWGAARFSV